MPAWYLPSWRDVQTLPLEAQDLIYKHKVAPLRPEEPALGDQVSLMQTGKLAMQLTNPGANNRFRTAGMPYDVCYFPLGAAAWRSVGA